MRVSELKEGQKGRIKRIDLSAKDKQRLFYLGIYEGGYLTLLQKAPLRDPLLLFAQGNQLILRKKDACCIDVEVEE